MPKPQHPTLAEIRDRIAGEEATAARAQEQLAELRRQETWAAGAEHRARLDAIRGDAEQIDTATVTADVAELAREAVDVLVRLQNGMRSHNHAVQSLRGRISAEGVPPNTSGTPTPSPAHGMLAPTSTGIAIGRRRIRTLEVDTIVNAVLAAARTTTEHPDPTSDDGLVALLVVDEVVPDFSSEARFYLNPDNGSTFVMDRPPAPSSGLVPIGRREYCCRVWGIEPDALPAEVFPPSAEVA